jgi:DNA-binding NtrC family response regulator
MNRTRILCVDDDRQINELNSIFLTRAGYEVETVPTPSEALQKIASNSYDVIITDLFLSGNSSVTDRDFVINLRKAVPEVPIILASGEHHPPEEILKHVNGFIPNAYSPNMLVDCVKDVLGREKQRKAV